MGSFKYIVFITLSYVDWGRAAFLQENAAARKFTAFEDTELFLLEAKQLGAGYGKDWIVMPDGNDTAHLAVIEMDAKLQWPSRTVKEYTFETASDLVTFNFFTKKREEALKFQLKDLHNMNFLTKKPTKLIFHGWMANENSSVITGIRDAYLAQEGVHVIGVDWSPISEDIFYPNSVLATQVVGKVIGHFIDSLVKKYGLQYGDFHLIGHSLGAHVAGFAGNWTRGKIGRITGLDPALPGFQYMSLPDGRLDESDAEFVDVIHTCAGVLGMSTPIGHVDFFPNGGSVFQPGCGSYNILYGPQACSHARAHQFFAESIKSTSGFVSVRCQDWSHFKKDQCDEVYTVMGENIPPDTQRGVYYLKTNRESPYAQGEKGVNF